MSFPPGTEMFQFPGLAPPAYGFGRRSPKREGFPHSDIRGSTIARISPRLFAACHVLHRLLAPRHPPNALVSLTIQPPKRPHAVPNRATSLPVQNSKPYAYPLNNYTSIPRFTCQRSAPARTSLSRGGLLEAAWLGTEVPAEASRCPAARRQPCRTSREESGAR